MNYRPNAFKATLILPMQSNAGEPFPAEACSWWLDQAVTLLKAFTELGTVQGFWGGHSEPNKMLFVVVREERQLDELRELLERARAVFEQEAMYFDCHPVHHQEIRGTAPRS